jgi:outer membrane lipoprotein carrier protein
MKTKLCFALFLVCTISFCQSASEILKKVQNKFNSINNFTAGFTQNYFNAQGQNAGKMEGKFSYKRKNKFIVDLKNQFIVSDGQTIWNNDSRFNRVVISKLNDDPTSFSLERFIFEYPPQCKITAAKDENYLKQNVIELTPKEQNMQFKSAKIWIDSDGMIDKMEIIDAGGMRYAFQFTEIKINQDLPDSKFSFSPAKGTKIIDLR